VPNTRAATPMAASAYNAVVSTATVANVGSTEPSNRSRAKSTMLTSGVTASSPLNSTPGIRLISPGARDNNMTGIK